MPNDKFNKLVNKYTSQGWDSLSDNEKAEYRSYYSNLVKPVGNNTYDAVNMMQPAEVTAKKNNVLYSDKPEHYYSLDAKWQDPYGDILSSQSFLMDWYESPMAKKMLQDSYTKEGFALSSPKDMIEAMKIYKGAKQKAEDNVDARVRNILKTNTDVVRFKEEDHPNALAYMRASDKNFNETALQYSRDILSEDMREKAKLAEEASRLPLYLGGYLAFENPNVPSFIKNNIGYPLMDYYLSPKYDEDIKQWKNKTLSDYVDKKTPSKLKGYPTVKTPIDDKYKYANEEDKAFMRMEDFRKNFKNPYVDLPHSSNDLTSEIKESPKSEYNVYLKEGKYDPTSILHEVGHISTDANSLLPTQDIKTIQEEISPESIMYSGDLPKVTYKKVNEKQNNNAVNSQYFISKPYSYYNNPTEVQTRLNVTRQQALQHGIYNPFKKLPTMEDVEKLKNLEDSNVQDLFDHYSKEHILKMLRTVAQNDKKPFKNSNDYA